MRWWIAAASMLLGVACGPRQAAPVEQEAPDPGPGCPATWAAAIGSDNGELCDAADYGEDDCVFPEGSCECASPPQCTRSDAESRSRVPLSWQCKWNAGVTRDDGCPGGPSPSGQACDSELTCGYNGSCCYEELACVDGTWHVQRGDCS